MEIRADEIRKLAAQSHGAQQVALARLKLALLRVLQVARPSPKLPGNGPGLLDKRN